MTDNEIIKALKCHKGVERCANCPLEGKRNCVSYLSYAAYDLINRQKTEIENLKYEIELLDDRHIRALMRSLAENAVDEEQEMTED